jgi:PAS domain S-box-containing protein
MPTPSILRFGTSTTEALFKTGLALVSALLVAALAWWTWWDFSDARGDAENRIAAAALVTRGHAARSLLAIDAVLVAIIEVAERDGFDALRSETHVEPLKHITMHLPNGSTISVHDEAGNHVPTTMAASAPAHSVADREWFKKIKAGNSELQVGRAIKGRSADRLFFPVSRAILGPDGTFKGAVQVGVEVGYLAELMHDLNLGPDTRLGLYRASDGAVIAHRPMTEELLNETVADLPYFAELDKTPRWTGWIEGHGGDRLVSAQRMRDVPIIAAVSIPKHEVYADAWRRTGWRGLALTTIWAALFALTGLAVRQARREEAFRERLSASEARFREMADHAPVMVWVSEPDHSCSFVSRSWYEFTGQTPGGGLGRGWEDAVHADDRAKMLAEARAHSGRHEPFQVEYRLRRRDGLYKWVLAAAAPRFDSHGVFLGYIGSVIDISARRETESALAESHRLLDSVIESLPAMLFMKRASDLRFTRLNRAGEKLLGYSREELLGKNDYDFFPKDQADFFTGIDRAVLASNEVREIPEERVRTRDGATRFLKTSKIVLRNADGTPTHLLGVSIDITERKQSEEHVKLLMREISHRAKNLLSVVQVMARHTASEVEPREFAGRFAQRLAGLAASHDLLVKSDWHGVHIADLVSSQLAHFGDVIGVRVFLDGPLLKLRPSAAQTIGMALHELGTNAAKYGALSAPEGIIEISWGVLGSGANARFRIRWSERDGPEPQSPRKGGFGRTVVIDMVKHALDAEVRLEYPPSGAIWELVAPVEWTLQSD